MLAPRHHRERKTVMRKAVYKNEKTNGYYTFDKQGLFNVYLAKDTSCEVKVDSKGRNYIVADVEPIISKNGNKIYIPVTTKLN